jgi:hypothetical protein
VIAEHLKGEKIRVFKYRPKKRYRRRAGHRSHLTRIEIREIKGPAAGKTARSAEGRKPAEAKPAAAQKGEAKSAPAKKKETAGGSPSTKGGARSSAKSKASKEG